MVWNRSSCFEGMISGGCSRVLLRHCLASLKQCLSVAKQCLSNDCEHPTAGYRIFILLAVAFLQNRCLGFLRVESSVLKDDIRFSFCLFFCLSFCVFGLVPIVGGPRTSEWLCFWTDFLWGRNSSFFSSIARRIEKQITHTKESLQLGKGEKNEKKRNEKMGVKVDERGKSNLVSG